MHVDDTVLAPLLARKGEITQKQITTMKKLVLQMSAFYSQVRV